MCAAEPHIQYVWRWEVGGGGSRDQSILRSNLYRPGLLQTQGLGRPYEVSTSCDFNWSWPRKIGPLHLVVNTLLTGQVSADTGVSTSKLSTKGHNILLPWLANRIGCNLRAATSFAIRQSSDKYITTERRKKCWFLAEVPYRCFHGVCWFCVGVRTVSEFGWRTEADREADWGEINEENDRSRRTVPESQALGGQHISEAVHCESRMPVNLSHHSIQHSSFHFIAPLDHSSHSSCETAACTQWCPIDLLFWKIHINMPNSCHIPNLWL